MIKVLKFGEFNGLYEATVSVSEPVALAVLGVPAGGKSYTMKKIKDVTDDSRVARALDKGVVLTVDKLRDEFLSKDPLNQLKGFIKAFYLMREKAKSNPGEYEKWFEDIKKLWSGKFKELLPSLKIEIDHDKLRFDGKTALKRLKDLQPSEEIEKAIKSLDNYQDYKRVVRYFQDIKQGNATKKMTDVTYDEAGDEPGKIVNNMKTLHRRGYVTDVFLIHPSNIASNLIQNFYRVVTGGDGGRDSSASIVQAFKDIEAKKDIYTRNAEVTVDAPSDDLQRAQGELRKANVEDDEKRGDKPIDVFTQVEPMPPKKGYETFSTKLDKDQREVFDAMLKYAAFSLDLPSDAKESLLKLTKSMSNSEALEVLRNAAESGKFVFKFGGVTPELVKKAQNVLK